GTFKGRQAMTRYEAAALLNACLDRVTEVTDELKRLMAEFEKELAVLRGRVDGLEARVGELEANQFSTTTKLNGQTTFVLGGNTYSGTGKVSRRNDAIREGILDQGELPRKNSKLAKRIKETQGGTVFNYDLRLHLDTSFTGKDLLRTRLRAGNFGNSPYGGGGIVGLDAMEVAFEGAPGANTVMVDRLFYQFPVGSSFTATVGGRVRQDDMLPVWPSLYPADTILDVFTYAGAPGTYSLNLGGGAGMWWKSGGFSVAANYVSANADNGNPSLGGVMTDGSASTATVQLAYAVDNWGLAAAYTYTSENSGGIYPGNGTPLAVLAMTEGNTNSFGLSGWWGPKSAGWVPSVSAGWGINSTNGPRRLGDITSQSWYVGLMWSDLFMKGNAAGMAVGQPTFVTNLEKGNLPKGDGNYAFEWWYKFQVTDNISVTPAIYYLSRPLAALTGTNATLNNFGGLIKTTFKF
ncbi:MAG: iron uptake porin, partial [Cyanobacteriota bacterium]|nr:iron uptake porin [Cyanobacteriota bacterium]